MAGIWTRGRVPDNGGDNAKVMVYRFSLDPPRFKTFQAGHYDRDKLAIARERGVSWHWHNEWFVKHLGALASYTGQTKLAILRDLFSSDPIARARVYSGLASYHGGQNFDGYPLTITEKEAYERYADELSATRRVARPGSGK